MPNALLVNPEFPPSYWGFKYALDFVGRKTAMPPVGLLTVAALFPEDWSLKVVDMNVARLEDEHLEWADLVLTTSMVVQHRSLAQIVERCNALGKLVVLGGPYPTSYLEEIEAAFPDEGGPDHYILDEVENIFPQFLEDLADGRAERVYREPNKPDVTLTPIPRFDLLELEEYGSMAVQFSRGCPFQCEFCDITQLFGRIPRTKTDEQMLAEFDALYRLGWRGTVFVVDDNFVGNKRDAMRFLKAAAAWQEDHDFPFMLFTEASVNVVEIPGMLTAMADAGFNFLFLGIESPNDAALEKTLKGQNTSKTMDARTYLLESVWKIQEHGMEVAGGFIIGLDGDVEFQSHIDFIRDAGIPRAMAGLLGVLKGTDLYKRMEKEGRLLSVFSGDNCDGTLNFVPELDAAELLAEYRRVLLELYDPRLEDYFARCLTFLARLQPRGHWVRSVSGREVMAFLKSVWRQGFSRQGPAWLRFLTTAFLKHRRVFPEAVRLAIMGYHFEMVTRQSLAAEDLRRFLDTEWAAIEESGIPLTSPVAARQFQSVLDSAARKRANLHVDFRQSVDGVLQSFRERLTGESPASVEASPSELATAEGGSPG